MYKYLSTEMFKRLKYIVATTLTALILFTTGGIHVFYHLCNCTNTIYLAVNNEIDRCGHSNNIQHDCCGEHLEYPVIKAEACCEDDSFFFRLGEYIVDNVNYTVNVKKVVTRFINNPAILVNNNDQDITPQIKRRTQAIPPLLTGKMLVIYLHQPKIPPVC